MHEEVEPRASTSCERVAEAIGPMILLGERMEAGIDKWTCYAGVDYD